MYRTLRFQIQFACKLPVRDFPSPRQQLSPRRKSLRDEIFTSLISADKIKSNNQANLSFHWKVVDLNKLLEKQLHLSINTMRSRFAQLSLITKRRSNRAERDRRRDVHQSNGQKATIVAFETLTVLSRTFDFIEGNKSPDHECLCN